MPKAELVWDNMGGYLPFRVTRRKPVRTSLRRTVAGRTRIKCGCCKRTLDISPDPELTRNVRVDALEINGVEGTVKQWRQVLIPLLQLQADDFNTARLAMRVLGKFPAGVVVADAEDGHKKTISSLDPGVDLHEVIRFVVQELTEVQSNSEQ